MITNIVAVVSWTSPTLGDVMARTDERFRMAYNDLLDICQQIEPDDALPSEQALAVKVGVSRTIVRNALTRLREQNIIDWQGRKKSLKRRPTSEDRFVTTEKSSSIDELEPLFLDWILHFDVPAGTALNVAQLSREFSVPPHTLQEFLTGLSRFGLVERRERGGWKLLGFTRDFAIELSEFRVLLELNAVRQLMLLPADHHIWTDLKNLEAAHLILYDEIDTRFHDFSKLDELFHATIGGVVKNRFVTEFQKVIPLIFHYHYTWNKADEQARNTIAIQEHIEWIRAMLAGDLAASEAAALQHLHTAKETLLASMRSHNLA